MKVVIVDSAPRWQFGEEINSKVRELGKRIELVLSKHEKMVEVLKQNNTGEKQCSEGD